MMKPISPIYINVKGRLLDLATPQVMGILNVTPDSFYSEIGRASCRERVYHCV